jgi:Na+/alanine symporter
MATDQSNSRMQQFLTPEAMVTPGVAGSLTMAITNALALNFDWPAAWVGLIISFVFGALVLVAAKNLLTKLAYYVINSLVIFCVAMGANGIATAHPEKAPAAVADIIRPPTSPSGGSKIEPAIRKPAVQPVAAKKFFTPWTF